MVVNRAYHTIREGYLRFRISCTDPLTNRISCTDPLTNRMKDETDRATSSVIILPNIIYTLGVFKQNLLEN